MSVEAAIASAGAPVLAEKSSEDIVTDETVVQSTLETVPEAMSEAVSEAVPEAASEAAPEAAVAVSVFDQYWAALEKSPRDFDTWVSMLSLVEQNADISQARQAFKKFLALFPLCFGYWKKYADLEEKLAGVGGVVSVYESGVAAIPQCVDLWVHYIKHMQAQEEVQVPGADSGKELLVLFEKAVNACGKDWKSWPLWDLYLAYLTAKGDVAAIGQVYARLFVTPNDQHEKYVASFQTFLSQNTVEAIATPEEIDTLKKETIASMGQMSDIAFSEEVKSKAVELRQKVAMATSIEVAKRRTYEERLSRNYFHVKDVDNQQRTAWKAYLTLMMDENNAKEDIEFLFERCLIVCALYEEFWLQYAYWQRDDHAAMATVLSRSLLFLHNKPNAFLALSTAYELLGGETGVASARATFQAATETFGSDNEGFVELAVRYSNFEKRNQNIDVARTVIDAAIAKCEASTAESTYLLNAKAELLASSGQPADARATYEQSIRANPADKTAYLRWLAFEQSAHAGGLEDLCARVESVFEVVKELGTENLSVVDMADFTIQRVRLLDSLTTDPAVLQSVRLEYYAKYGMGSTFNPAALIAKRALQDASVPVSVKHTKVAMPVTAHSDEAAAHAVWAAQQQQVPQHQQWAGYNQQAYQQQPHQQQQWGYHGWGQ
eukprot:CFRG3785T1